MENEMEMDEREMGIQAIIDLQAVMGIEEPRERAAEAWDSFEDYQKEQTMFMHGIFCKK